MVLKTMKRNAMAKIKGVAQHHQQCATRQHRSVIGRPQYIPRIGPTRDSATRPTHRSLPPLRQNVRTLKRSNVLTFLTGFSPDIITHVGHLCQYSSTSAGGECSGCGLSQRTAWI